VLCMYVWICFREFGGVCGTWLLLSWYIDADPNSRNLTCEVLIDNPNSRNLGMWLVLCNLTGVLHLTAAL
jgi:hypothetical protein